MFDIPHNSNKDHIQSIRIKLKSDENSKAIKVDKRLDIPILTKNDYIDKMNCILVDQTEFLKLALCKIGSYLTITH